MFQPFNADGRGKHSRDSGKKNSIMNWIPAGTAPSPTIQRQPPLKFSKAAPSYEFGKKALPKMTLPQTDAIRHDLSTSDHHHVQDHHPSAKSRWGQFLDV